MFATVHPMKPWVVLCSCVAVLALPRQALAYEGQHHVALEPGLLLDDPLHARFDAHYMFDASDSWRLSAGLTHASGDFSRTGARVGVAYVLDVLRYVPWLSASAGADAWRDGEVRAVAALAGGLDISWSRQWATGLQYKQEWVLGQAEGAPASAESIGLRAMVTWGL